MPLLRGSTSITVHLYAVDAVTGQPKTGLTASDVTLKWSFARGNAAGLILSDLGSRTDAYSEGGFIELDAVDQPGVYRLDTSSFTGNPPAGIDEVIITPTAAGVLFAPLRIAFYPPEHVSELSGSRTWTVHVESPAATVLPNAKVSIRNAADDTILAAKITDSNGDAVFTASDGPYNVHVEALGVATFTNPTPVTLSADVTSTIVGTPFSPSGSAGVDECLVSIWVEGADGTETITAKLKGAPKTQNTVVLSAAKKSATWQTDHFEVALARKETFVIELPPSTGRGPIDYVVPDLASANLAIT